MVNDNLYKAFLSMYITGFFLLGYFDGRVLENAFGLVCREMLTCESLLLLNLLSLNDDCLGLDLI